MKHKYLDKEKAIAEIMQEFDFKAAHKVYKKLKWGWSGKGIPKVKDIKKQAKEHLETACSCVTPSKETYYISSGGLKATAHYHKKGIYKLGLELVVENWSVNAYED